MTIKYPASSNPDIGKLSKIAQQLAQGRSNACGTITLTINVGSTVVTALNCAIGSKVFLFPTTAQAAAEIAAGGCYISSVGQKTFTITHANNANASRTFFFACLG